MQNRWNFLKTGFYEGINIEIPEGVRFKDYLASRFHGRLVVVQDVDTPARIAIATPENHARVHQVISAHDSLGSNDSQVDHTRLPFSLIAAFCKIPLPNAKVYFRITRPFRYETLMQAPDDNYMAIDDDFRPSSLAGRSVHGLSDIEKKTVFEHIDEWAKRNSIDLRQLYYEHGGRPYQPREPSGIRGNALQRLIDAQDPELKGRIKIPGDVASVLMHVP